MRTGSGGAKEGHEPPRANDQERIQERILSRAWQNLPWTLSLAAALALPAAAQNLDAGKSPGQIFSEVCANCHRSLRDFKNGVSASFLREHYTTSAEMASTMAAYLSGARRDPRGVPSAPATTAREGAAPDLQREPRRPQQPAPKAGGPGQVSPGPVPPSQVSGRNHPATARADAAKPAEEKPSSPPPPPALEEFEE